MMLAIVISSVVFKFYQSEQGEATLSSGRSVWQKSSDRSGWQKSSKRSEGQAKASNKTEQASSIETKQAPQAESIVFDPNTASAETLLKVGLAPWQVKSIMNYRAKGGAYHRKDDFKRLYGLTYGQWEHIEPLIQIGKEYQYIADNEDLGYRKQPTASHKDTIDASPNGEQNNRIVKLHKGERIDINLNDTLLMQSIPGIGPVKAYNLSKYISRLGGLASADQLNDAALTDMPLGLEDYIDIDITKIRKLRINKLTAKQLTSHPYINWNQARQITERVRQYGPLKNWNELLFLSEFTEADRSRLEPYVSFE